MSLFPLESHHETIVVKNSADTEMSLVAYANLSRGDQIRFAADQAFHVVGTPPGPHVMKGSTAAAEAAQAGS